MKTLASTLILTIITLVSFTNTTEAQQSLSNNLPLLAQVETLSTVFTQQTEYVPLVATTADYPGGKSSLKFFFENNLDYPELARDYEVEGEVIVAIKIDENGSIADMGIKKSLGYGCDQAALKAVEKMPTWKAAQFGSRKIASWVYVPISFSMR